MFGYTVIPEGVPIRGLTSGGLLLTTVSGIVTTGTGPVGGPAVAAPPVAPEAPEAATDPWLPTGLEAPAGLVVSLTTLPSPLLVTWRLGPTLAIGVSLAGAALGLLGLRESLALSPLVRLLLLPPDLDLDLFLDLDLSGWELPLLPCVWGRLALQTPELTA